MTDIFALAALVAQVALIAPGLPPDRSAAPHRVPHPIELARASSPPNVDYSDAYYRRLDVHRAASRLMLPLFALQQVAGQRLLDESSDAPGWAKVGHRVGATGVAAVFATNLVTGVPNILEGLKDPRDRKRRILHATLMLTASAGFTATGLLAERAEGDPDARQLHRNTAYASIGIATVAYLMMLDTFRGN